MSGASEKKRCERLAYEISNSNYLGFSLEVVESDDIDFAILNNGLAFRPFFTERFTDDELAFCVGHEFAHALHHHVASSYCLSDISVYVHKRLLEISDKEKFVSDALFLNAVNKRFEFEADVLGDYLSRQAGYNGAASALNKFDKGLDMYCQLLDEHPHCQERVRYLVEHPVDRFDRRAAASEYHFLTDLSLKILDNNVTDQDFALMVLTEKKYISEACQLLRDAKSFLYSRESVIDDLLKNQIVSKNIISNLTFHNVLKSYRNLLDKSGNVAVIPVVRDESEDIFSEMSAVHDKIKKNFFHSVSNSVSAFVNDLDKKARKGNER